MNEIKNISFPMFCTWVLSKPDRDTPANLVLDDCVIERWLKFYNSIFNIEDNIIDVKKNRRNITFTTFIGFYFFYKAITTGENNVVIERTGLIRKTIENLSFVFSKILKDELIKSKTVSKLTFNNKNTISFMSPTPYSLVGVQYNLVVFDEIFIKNIKKIYGDIDNAKKSGNKMILVITNDLTSQNLKTIEI